MFGSIRIKDRTWVGIYILGLQLVPEVKTTYVRRYLWFKHKIKERETGRWKIILTYMNINGFRKTDAVYYDNEAECRDEYEKLNEAILTPHQYTNRKLPPLPRHVPHPPKKPDHLRVIKDDKENE